MGLFSKKTIEKPEVSVDEEIFAELDKVAEEVEETKPSNVTIVPQGEVFVGDFISTETIIVGGTVNGKIRTSADSYITQQGKCKGEIFTKNLFIEGNVEAKSVVEDTAQIKNTGVYNGYMETTKLDTEYGSVFNGSLNLKMKTAPAPVAETAVEPTTSEGKREVVDIEMSFK